MATVFVLIKVFGFIAIEFFSMYGASMFFGKRNIPNGLAFLIVILMAITFWSISESGVLLWSILK